MSHLWQLVEAVHVIIIAIALVQIRYGSCVVEATSTMLNLL